MRVGSECCVVLYSIVIVGECFLLMGLRPGGITLPWCQLVSKHLLLVELVPVVWDNSLQPTFLPLSEWAMMLRPNEFIPPIQVTIVHEELHRGSSMEASGMFLVMYR